MVVGIILVAGAINCLMVMPKIAPLPVRTPVADAAQSTDGRE
ncbi:hypothetical protein ACWEWX_04885 [Streptomyces asiaticus]